MKREKLVEIVDAAVRAEGYAFYSGEAQGLNGTVRVWPAAWLTPPVVKSCTGRAEGEAVYRIVLHLMVLPSSSPEHKTVWERLERDALTIAGSIACCPEVCAVGGISVTPARGSLTVNSEVSVALTADITMWYYI